ncbi:MAG: DUF2281 domain-containing protein [Pyrinomonadaceae bacterium]
MTHEEMLRELAALPPEGQMEVADFIASLRQRYGTSRPREEAVVPDLNTESFVGIWRDRDDMQDSSAWVRGNREREWAK